jgi:hypothetical protein
MRKNIATKKRNQQIHVFWFPTKNRKINRLLQPAGKKHPTQKRYEFKLESKPQHVQSKKKQIEIQMPEDEPLLDTSEIKKIIKNRRTKSKSML